MRLKLLFLLAIVLGTSTTMWAQAPLSAKKLYAGSLLELSFFHGMILMHDEKIRHLVQSHPSAAKLNYLLRTSGLKTWHQLYGFPEFGVALEYQHYRHPSLGKSISLIPNLNLYVYRGRYSSVLGNMGVGIAYHTNPYHRTYNTQNLALGSTLSFALNIALKYQHRLSTDLAAGAFVHLDHYSNGGLKKPNSGLNLVQGGFYLRQEFQRKEIYKPQNERAAFQPQKTYLTVLPSISFKELGRGGGVLHSSYNLSLHLNKQVSHLSVLNFGLDAYWDIARKKWIAQMHDGDEVDYKTIALSGGHELMINKVAFLTQLGYHIYQPYKGLYGELFQKYGLRVYVHPQLAISGSLKSYLGKAEHIEWGLLLKL